MTSRYSSIECPWPGHGASLRRPSSARPARRRALRSAGAARVRLPARHRPARWRGRSPTRCPTASRKGSVLSVTLRPPLDAGRGRRRRRRRARRASSRSRPGRVLDEIPPTLVDLALWLADYYGSTPARALELVAPLRRAPRSERPSPAARESLAGEPEPAALTDGQRAGGRPHRRRASTRASASTSCSTARPAAARPRSTSRRARRRSSAASGRSCSSPRSRSRRRPSAGSGSASATRVAILHSVARRGRAARRARPDRARGGADRRRRPLGDLRADARRRPDRRRRGARRRVQAGVRSRATTRAPSPRSAPRSRARSPSTAARPRGPRAGCGSSASSLSARIGAPLPPVRLVDLRREAGYPLSAPLLAALGGIVERGGRAILLLNRRGVAPAIHCRACGVSRRCPLCDVALTLHRDDGAALPPLRAPRARAEAAAPPAARSSSRGSAPARSASRRSSSGALPELERIRLDADVSARPGAVREALERFSRGGARGPRRHADGREGPPLPGRRARGGRRRRHRASRSRTSGPRSARSSSSPSSPGAAAATRRGASSSRPSSPTRRRCGTPSTARRRRVPRR